MRESTFISKSLALYLILLSAFGASAALAADAGPSGGVPGPAGKDKTLQPEEDDFQQTPYTQYGEFNEQDEEAADTQFFQFGRFFGVSLGVGGESVTGDRGALYQGGIPLFDFKVHYWFDFNFALDLGGFVVSHNYNSSATGQVNVNILELGLHLKYYFDTKDMSAPVTFANPYLLLGGGAFTKTSTSIAQNVTGGTGTGDTGIGLTVGGGLEFALKPRKVYFEVEGCVDIVQYQDTYSGAFTSAGIPDLTGLFIRYTASFLFTW